MNLTITEAAKELRMSAVWVRNKINAGKINIIRMGGKIFVPKKEVERILREGVK